MKPKGKPKLPRAPLPRQTEKVHSSRKKPLPPIDYFEEWEGLEDEPDYSEPDIRPEHDPWDV